MSLTLSIFFECPGVPVFFQLQSLQEDRWWQQQPWQQGGALRAVADYSQNYAGSALGKRQSFGAWAGKRNGLPANHSNLVLRLQSFLKDKILHRDLSNKRQQFSAWAGKRSSTESDGDVVQEVKEQNSNIEREFGDDALLLSKRRDSGGDETEAADLRQILNSIRDASVARRAFSAWSGKRGFSAWAGKRTELTN
ncbi:hypothetical protein FHG87_010003 [Trinorchestia longiramus]|nr:hypothetical protein FHG87_010003 [Trinorchestia longiramus]